ncbi:MAG: bacteriohemerythrin [Spirochaetaceae bacterium]|jgi:hemerythrin|nr:bacteriohemerythrin [Spirochaetaceae bacterium]
MTKNNLIEWSDRYRIGIPLIDEQHKKLIDMTNTLYTGCLEGDKEARIYFLKTIHEAVDYVRFHFSTEEKLLERIKYPDLTAHKKQHEDFAREIISQVQAFQQGKPFVPNVFVRYLRDWVLTHIAVSDKLYAAYLLELKKQGVLFSMAIKAEYVAMRIRRWLGRAPVYIGNL